MPLCPGGYGGTCTPEQSVGDTSSCAGHDCSPASGGTVDVRICEGHDCPGTVDFHICQGHDCPGTTPQKAAAKKAAPAPQASTGCGFGPACVLTNAIGTVASVVRPPDYFSFDLSGSPFLFAPFIQVGVNITYTRDGKLYIGPEAGPGFPGLGASARAGWIDQLHQPSKTYTDNFIGGPSLTGSGYVPLIGLPGGAGLGPSFGEQWGNEGQPGLENFSTEAGIGVGALHNAQVTQSWSFEMPFQGPGW